MATDNKYFETGSNPYYLNLNNTAKEFSIVEATNPPYGLLDTLSKFIIIEDDSIIEPQKVKEEFVPANFLKRQ